MNLIEIKGIGPKLYNTLKERNITDIKSLVYTFPISYTDYHLGEFSYTEKFTIKAFIIDEIKIDKTKKIKKVTFDLLINDLKYSCIAFNMEYLSKTFKIGDEIVVVGYYSNDFKNIIIEKVFKPESFKEGIIPEYNIDGVSNSVFQKIVLGALEYYTIEEPIIPESYLKKYSKVLGKDLLYAIHCPKTIDDYTNAKTILKYYELLEFSIKLNLIRLFKDSLRKKPKKCDTLQIKNFIDNDLSFKLTRDQMLSINAIFKGFGKSTPLNMLLEGDVGCGKTIIAVICAYAIYTAGYQSLVLVPTEALANQHYQTFSSYLEKHNIKVALLTSSTKPKERSNILDELKDGKIDVIIGTHSLLNEEVVFNKLGFVVCDEQHKFGVDQRKRIREKGVNPDTLYMTATPIPRTLALTIFKDMDIIKIKQLPASRKTITTRVHTYKDYLRVLNFVKSEIDDNRQAYFVAPIIDENPDSTVVSVLRIKADLEKYYKGSVRIGLLHGKLNELEKDEVLSSFQNKKIDILVSTTVIEVGINNPNASTMVIIDANHFGLSTIHQLRGRVGRGSDEGYCFLMVESKDYINKLKILESTQDGFLISEEDLKLRGPGDFLGKDQSGMIKFNYANIVKDSGLASLAMSDASELIKDEKIRKHYTKQLYSYMFD